MRKNIFSLLFFSLFLLLITISCNDDIDEIIPVMNEAVPAYDTTLVEEPIDTVIEIQEHSRIKDFFESAPSISQFTSINPSTVNLVGGEQGTKLEIPSNIFEHLNGDAVSGNIDIEMIEIFSRGDMVAQNKTTTSGGATLVSGGELYIMAYENGQQLKIKDGESMTIRVPAITDAPDQWSMMKFYGDIDLDGNIDWQLDPDGGQTITITEEQDTSGEFGLVFLFPESNLGWINCDYFYNGTDLTDFSVAVSDSSTLVNTAVFVIFEDITSVCRIYNFNETSGLFVLDGGYQIPIGESVVVFGVSVFEDTYYADFVNVTTVADMTVNLNLAEMDIDDIYSMLQNF